MKILNLTQHAASPEQVAACVFEPADKATVQRLLTFDSLPTREDLVGRAERLADIASNEHADAAMIGGAGYLMGPLESALIYRSVLPLHAFSVRESVEQTLPDGSVKKVAVFRHAGFVGA